MERRYPILNGYEFMPISFIFVTLMISIIIFYRDIHRVNQILISKVEDEVIMNYLYLQLYIILCSKLPVFADPLNQVCTKTPEVLGPKDY